MDAAERERRAGLVLVGTLFVVLGALLGSSGCGALLCQCGSLDPFLPGTFVIVNSPDRAELIGGVVHADEQTGVEISFTRDDGSTWVITYDVADTSP
jgi:hypothetical protein